ncbi:ABC transporter substrate-binding protein [Clostridium thermosuccinogenes]|nr:extracellular solute-binding protein [Pseudoclostridium thermosuccinogenes]
MKKVFEKFLAGTVAACMMISLLSGCGKSSEGAKNDTSSSETKTSASESTAKKEPIKIKYPSYRVGTHVSAPAEKKILDAFREKYGDEVIVEVEEIPSDQTYVDKMKILAASKDMPDIVEGKNGINNVLISANLAVPLNKYLDEDPQWKEEIGQKAIEANSRDGKCWSISTARQIVGYFYNKEMFEKAGIKPAETWEEFESNLEKLKSAGFTPLALMTGENAWTTNLILASIIGTSGEAGNNFMNTLYPKNFETPEVIDALAKIQAMLQNYTTTDALGAAYANAANNFCQGKAAIIANGPWMIPDFSNPDKAPEGFEQKVGVAMYPNAGIFSSFEEGFMLCSKDDVHREAALKFLKFRTGAFAQSVMLEMNSVTPLTENVKPSEEFKKKYPLFMEINEFAAKAKYNYKFLDTINYANVTDAWKNIYPELAFNKVTPEQAAKMLSDVAAKNKD